jgi:hypothetical protein
LNGPEGVTLVAVLTMSDGELARADTLRDLDQNRLTIEAAQQLLGLSRRQVFRLLKIYRSQGNVGLISKKRGRPSNRKTPDEVRGAAMAIVRERYADFGPTLAAEKLGGCCQSNGNSSPPGRTDPKPKWRLGHD